MNDQFLNENPSHAYSGMNFTSQFFGNFIDNSHVSHTNKQIQSQASISSHMSSMDQSEQHNNNDFSINDDKLKQFHLQNLVFLFQTLSKRLTIQRWMNEKNRLKRLQKMTSNYATKVILKVFYSLSIKLQVKCSFAFRKIHRLNQETKNVQPQTSKLDAFCQLKSKSVMSEQQQANSQRKIETAAIFATLLGKLQVKYQQKHQIKTSFHSIHQYCQKHLSLQSISNILASINIEFLGQGWSGLRNWINYLQKIEILEGTVNLLVHLCMRKAFWLITVQKSSLECNDISNIKQYKSRKQSFKMNNSTQSIAIQKELLDNIPVIDFRSNQVHYHEQQFIKDSNRSIKSKDIESIDRNDPKHLKFSKDVKRKTVPTQHTSIIQQELDQQNQVDNQQNSQFIAAAAQQTSEIKPQNEDFSMIRRNSVTMNTSIYQSKSILKKMHYPIQLNADKSYKIITQLYEDDMPKVLNEGKVNKHFQNNNKIFKTKALKHEQLRRQFTDFNDLFTARQILSFYQGARCGIEQTKKGISLAKIKQKVNIKTQQQYYSRHKLQTQPNEQQNQRVIATQVNLDRSSSRNSRRGLQNTFNSIKVNNSQSRQRNQSKDRTRRAEFRIPSELPKNFDYYVDKSLKKQAKLQKASSSDFKLSSSQAESKRKSVCSKSRKKLLFNVVKSGSNRVSGEHQQRKKVSLEVQVNKMSSLRPKIDLNSKKSPKQARQTKESRSPTSNCEYFMTFRDPPKKKIKKGILKNDQ